MFVSTERIGRKFAPAGWGGKAAKALPLLLAFGCTSPAGDPLSPSAPDPEQGTAGAAPAPASGGHTSASIAPAPATPLRVKFLGVAGFLLEHGDDALMTAPLYTRPSLVDATIGLPIVSDRALVEQHLPTPTLAGVRAILSGHAHYDHLLDVPSVLARAPHATLYANRSAQNLLAAFAPDRTPACTEAPSPIDTILRERVVAMDALGASVVDYRNCPSRKPPNAPLEGSWVDVPGGNMRIYAVCSAHPPQFGPVHYGVGEVEQNACEPPQAMAEWKEGTTLAYLIDFLDPLTKAVNYRVYYQDAPTSAPNGEVPLDVLAGKEVDLALLCVGTYAAVVGAPTHDIVHLAPRYTLGGHWEDFFEPAGASPKPIPGLDVGEWMTRATAAMPSPGEPLAMKRNGAPEPLRALLPNPGDFFEVPRRTQ